MRTFAKLSIISTAMIITTTAFADPMMQYNTKKTNSDIQKLEKFEYHEGETLEEYLNSQPKGNLYSSEEEVLSVLMGGVNNGDYRKETSSGWKEGLMFEGIAPCLLYTSPSPRDLDLSRMPSSA